MIRTILGAGAEVFRLGFNIGSGQKSAVEYLDWMQTNLLNGGDVIDFQAVPEPSTWAAGILTASALGSSLLRRRKVRR